MLMDVASLQSTHDIWPTGKWFPGPDIVGRNLIIFSKDGENRNIPHSIPKLVFYAHWESRIQSKPREIPDQTFQYHRSKNTENIWL